MIISRLYSIIKKRGDMMNKSKYNGIVIALFVLTLIYMVYLYPKLPNDLPMQFSMSGEVNWTLPKLLGLFMSLGIELILIVSYLVKKENEMSTFMITVLVCLIMNGFMSYIAFFM